MSDTPSLALTLIPTDATDINIRQVMIGLDPAIYVRVRDEDTLEVLVALPAFDGDTDDMRTNAAELLEYVAATLRPEGGVFDDA